MICQALKCLCVRAMPLAVLRHDCIATRDASTLSHCHHVCHVSRGTVFELGIGLWRTQHVTEDPTNLQTMDVILHEGLFGKSMCLISIFRRVLDDTCTDKLHEAILDLLKQLIPGYNRPTLEDCCVLLLMSHSADRPFSYVCHCLLTLVSVWKQALVLHHVRACCASLA